ncbi:hypothetical protein [Tenacibaculum aiptasiae]|uniref:hypothetical protein n=1 Tax=Tenacibaculum aiptasiae TaxID=426481 RepID=UPI00232E4488|nr:hypothetical protein [Tenacibaculum aiptasiae]
MENNNTQLKSIWGTWWEPIRKWFYPSWLIYETSIRFYSYSKPIYQYFIKQQVSISQYIGEIGTQVLGIFCSLSTFIICSVFLTLPASYLLFKVFKSENLTSTLFEQKLKSYF